MTRRIIDVHVHLYPERRLGGLMRWLHREIPTHPVPVDVDVSRIVRDLRDAGVVRFLCAVFPLAPGEAEGLNRFVASLAHGIPGMVPLCTVHPEDGDPEAVVREAVEGMGLAGVKLHPMMMRMDPLNPRMEPVFRFLDRRRLPLLIHTGMEPGCPRERGRDRWERLFARYPGIPFLLAHAFFPDLPFAFGLLPRFPNLHLDITNVPGLLAWGGDPLPFGVPRSSWGPREFAAAVERAPDRVLFGSDHPAGMGTMAQIVGQVESLGLSPETRDRVLYGNALALLRRAGAE